MLWAGKPGFEKLRIAVWMLAQQQRLGFNDAQILADYPGLLSPNDLEAAWQYRDEHPEEIEEAIRRNEDGPIDPDHPIVVGTPITVFALRSDRKGLAHVGKEVTDTESRSAHCS